MMVSSGCKAPAAGLLGGRLDALSGIQGRRAEREARPSFHPAEGSGRMPVNERERASHARGLIRKRPIHYTK